MPEPSSFGAYLRQRRKTLGMTQLALANAVGFSLSLIRKLETGERPAPQSLPMLEKFAGALRLTSEECSTLIRLAQRVLPSTEASAPATRSNLPAPLTALIGRDEELLRLRELLGRPALRLLSLVGPGGSGKTRLSLALAQAALADFDEVIFVSLVSLRDPALVIPAIARACSVAPKHEEPLLAGLCKALRDRCMLLVLDNFEQVVQAAGALGPLLEAAPRLKIVATSRLRLQLYGEHLYPVPPLPLPAGEGDAAKLASAPAVALFLERARAAGGCDQPPVEDLRAIAQICRRLDGLPLAIELAAVRARLLGPRQIATQLDRRLLLLSENLLHTPERHQTLRSAMDWSYELLGKPERQLFCALSVLLGRWSGAAAAAIGAAVGLAAAQVADALGVLLDHNLLQRVPDGNGAPRYQMLETIHEYAAELLADEPRAPALPALHAAFFLRLAEDAEARLSGSAWLDYLEEEYPNLRQALGWLTQCGQLEQALRLAASLSRFWWIRSYADEGRRWLAKVLGQPGTSAPAVRARALHGASRLAWLHADYDLAGGYADESLSLRLAAGDRRGAAQTLNMRGLQLVWQGEYGLALEMLERSVAIWRELDDRLGLAEALNGVGMVAEHCEDFDRSEALSREALEIFRQAGYNEGIARSLNRLGENNRCRERYDQALPLYQESLALWRSLSSKSDIATMLHNLGQVALAQGVAPEAAEHFGESLALCREVGDKEGYLLCLAGLAETAVAQGQLERAAQLFGATSAIAETMGFSLQIADRRPYDRALALLRQQLEPQTCQRLWEAGAALALEQAVALALG